MVINVRPLLVVRTPGKVVPPPLLLRLTNNHSVFCSNFSISVVGCYSLELLVLLAVLYVKYNGSFINNQ